MQAYYSNLIAYRVTATELVLEFGNFFVGQENRTQADPADFHLRVVMASDILELLIKNLIDAQASRDNFRRMGATIPSQSKLKDNNG